MAKKRKLTPKSDESSNPQQKKQLKQDPKSKKKQEEELQQAQKLAEEQQKQQQAQVEEEEEEEEYEEVEEEEEEEEEDDEENNQNDAVQAQNDDGEEEEEDDSDEDDDDDDGEPVQRILEPFGKDQLIGLLSRAAEAHPDVMKLIKKMANDDPVQRKIFVHGLGWDTTADTLRAAFGQYGEIEDCKSVMDKVSGKSKGYGFILFKTRAGARRALKEPQKRIGNRMTACQLAAIGPVSAGGVGPQQGGYQQQLGGPAGGSVSEYTQRKIYISNVSADIVPQRLMAYFGKYGEIEEGPLGLDKNTGKFKGFCLFVYRSVDSAKRALEEPHKQFEGHTLHCQKAIDGPKPGKQQQGQMRPQNQFGRNDNPNLAGAIGAGPATGAGLMGQSLPFNQGAAAPVLNPALGQALTALLTSQGAGLGLNSLLGTLGGGMGAPGAAAPGIQGGYGAQGVSGVNPSVLGGYGGQGGLQSAYPSQQMGQGGTSRSQHGHGGVAPYGGH